MFRLTFINIFESTWPMILICSVILSSMRLTYIIKNKVPFILYKELLYLFFAMYIMCLFYVVTFQDVDWSTSNFIPFKEMFRYEIGSSLFFKNVLGNLLMFIPFGFFTSYILKIKKLPISLLLVVLASVTIEVTQLLIGRVFDIDDIILNVLGGIVGYYLYYFIDFMKNSLPAVFRKNTIYDIVIIIIIVLAVLYLTNIIPLGV